MHWNTVSLVQWSTHLLPVMRDPGSIPRRVVKWYRDSPASRGLYFGQKTIFIPPPPTFWKLYFIPLSQHIVFRLPSWPFCFNSSLFCIYFTLLLPLFSFSFHFPPFSVPFLPFSFIFSPFFSSPFHIFSPKWHLLICPPPPGGGVFSNI